MTQNCSWFISLVICLVPASEILCEELNLLWPVDAAPALTSTFCEVRSGHFHSGIDVRTYGRIGLPCFAVADGYIARVRTSPSGYGKALYLKADSGLIFVYAHLEGFIPGIEQIIRTEQHRSGKYGIDMSFETVDRINVSRGDIVCFAGQSGVRHPHLHFEIRDSWSEVVNPLVYGFSFPDHRPPIPVALAFIPLDESSTAERDNQPRIYSEVYLQEDGVYRTREPIGISGSIGISLRIYDKADRSENILAPYRLEFNADDELIWLTQFDTFSFKEERQVEVERDYLLKSHGQGEFHRLYRSPGNELFRSNGDGIVYFPGDRTEPMECSITASDAAGNKTILEFQLVSDQQPAGDRVVNGIQLFPYWESKESANGALIVRYLNSYFQFAGPPGVAGFRVEGETDFIQATDIDGGVSSAWKPGTDFRGKLTLTAFDRNDHFISQLEHQYYPAFPDKDTTLVLEDASLFLEIPQFAVYDTTWFWFKPEPNYEVPGFIESVYSIAPAWQPLSEPARIGIRQNFSQFESGWGIYSYSQKQGWVFEGDEIDNRYITACTRKLGTFSLVRDCDAPVIEILTPLDSSVCRTAKPRIEATVIDQLSGIEPDGIVVKLDHKAVPVEYDPPRDRIIYQTWNKLNSGDHLLEVSVTDRVGNKTVRTARFIVEP